MSIEEVLKELVGETVCYEKVKGGEKGCFRLELTFLGNLPIFSLGRHGFVSKDVKSVSVRGSGVHKIVFYGPSFHREEY